VHFSHEAVLTASLPLGWNSLKTGMSGTARTTSRPIFLQDKREIDQDKLATSPIVARFDRLAVRPHVLVCTPESTPTSTE